MFMHDKLLIVAKINKKVDKTVKLQVDLDLDDLDRLLDAILDFCGPACLQ